MLNLCVFVVLSSSVPSFLYVSDSPLVSMKKKRNTYRCGQRTVRLAGCGIQEIQSSSKNAVFARRRSKVKQKLWTITKSREKDLVVRAGVTVHTSMNPIC
ncbi:hypothetical protein TNCV_467261 [Trichonephila clavipes]|nr:hypothetical protein TNCV_467261 [Trichonephila clavipes]